MLNPSWSVSISAGISKTGSTFSYPCNIFTAPGPTSWLHVGTIGSSRTCYKTEQANSDPNSTQFPCEMDDLNLLNPSGWSFRKRGESGFKCLMKYRNPVIFRTFMNAWTLSSNSRYQELIHCAKKNVLQILVKNHYQRTSLLMLTLPSSTTIWKMPPTPFQPTTFWLVQSTSMLTLNQKTQQKLPSTK